jgi:hypothetical protein
MGPSHMYIAEVTLSYVHIIWPFDSGLLFLGFARMAFELKRTELQRKLSCATSLEMNNIIKQELKFQFKVEEACDLFASERAKAASRILELLCQENSGAVESGVIMHDVLASVWTRCSKRLEIDEALRGAAQAQAMVGTGTGGRTDEAKRQEIGASSSVVGSSSAVAVGVLMPLGLSKFWLSLVCGEMRGNDFDVFYVNKLIIAAANFELGKLQWKANTKCGHLCVRSKTVQSNSVDGKEKSYFEVTRERVGDDPTGAEPEVSLDFVGRIVDATTAAALSKQYCLPLHIGEGEGPALFIDGSANSNPKKSDLAFAWMIPPLPLTKKEAATALAVKVGTTTANSIAPPFKKARKSLQGDKFELESTHEIKYVAFDLVVPGTNGEPLTYEYMRPVLINHSGLGASIYGRPCYRQLADWDVAESAKRVVKPKSIRGFVLS